MYVHEDYARKLVLKDKLHEVLSLHRRGESCVSPVLTYSAKRGKHTMTQALIAEGITVTRDAIQYAARLGGPGVDLLLAGIREGTPLEMARHDALHAYLFYGASDRAISMLESGVRPTHECYSALETGARRDTSTPEAWKALCHPLLDAMLARTPIEQFTSPTLKVLLQAGRPIHIERALEILQKPPLHFFIPAIAYSAHEAIQTLRRLGMRMDDDTFLQVSADLASRSFVARLHLKALLDLYVEDSGQTMRVKVVEPLLMAALYDQEHFLRGISGPNDDGYKRANTVLLPYFNCMHPEEHIKLFEVIDRWAVRATVKFGPLSPVVTAVMKHSIQIANGLALAQLTGLGCPSP